MYLSVDQSSDKSPAKVPQGVEPPLQGEAWTDVCKHDNINKNGEIGFFRRAARKGQGVAARRADWRNQEPLVFKIMDKCLPFQVICHIW